MWTSITTVALVRVNTSANMADLNTLLMVAIVAIVFGVCHLVHGEARAEGQAVQRLGPEDKGDCDFNPADPISIVTHHNDGNYWGIGEKKHWKLSNYIDLNIVDREAAPYNYVPDDLDAGFSMVWPQPHEYVDYSYLFKGKQYWRVSYNSLNAGYPKPIKDFWGGLEDVDATLRILQTSLLLNHPPLLYFFKGSQYWEYDTVNDKVMDGYPQPISSYWRGLPNDLDGALQAPGGDKYFIKGGQYYMITKTRDTYVEVSKVGSPFAWCYPGANIIG